MHLLLDRVIFTSSFATPTQRLSSASCIPLGAFETDCFASPWNGREERSPAAASTASFGNSQCAGAACFPLLRSAATLQRIPAECGLMGQPWHGSQSLWGVIRICWQSASSVGAILHSLFRASLKGKPPFALSLYSRREAAGACLPLSRSLRNSWLESLI